MSGSSMIFSAMPLYGMLQHLKVYLVQHNTNNNNNNNKICVAQVCRMTSVALDGQFSALEMGAVYAVL